MIPHLDANRRQQAEWLLELTQIPTATGREWRVVDWIEAWVASRPGLRLDRDAGGNLTVTMRDEPSTGAAPVYITAHMDHPAFVVERIVAPGVVEMSFRGGVMDVFFDGAPVTVHESSGITRKAKLTGPSEVSSPMGKHYVAEVDGGTSGVNVGDVATWELPPAEIDAEGLVHTHACDDLSALAAAVCAMDELLKRRLRGESMEPTRLFFTRAEEIGFIGAIAACKLGTIPRGARVIALENSRSFADSPIGGGPIVRVGDRISVFTPWLTSACSKRAEQVTGAPVGPTASQTSAAVGALKWQRKLMAGGACEASVFCAYGYDATCLCLPLGNYHNMPHLTELQAGTFDSAKLGPARAAREFIGLSDYFGMIDLLIAIGQQLPREDPVMERIEKLYAEKGSVLKS